MKTYLLYSIILFISFACHVETESNSTPNKNKSTITEHESGLSTSNKQVPIEYYENWMNFHFDKVIAFATVDPFLRIPNSGNRIDLTNLKDTISITLTKKQISTLDSVIIGKKNFDTTNISRADCFNPRHNIIFLNQDTVVNYILVCYECGYYRTSKNGIKGNLVAFKTFFDNLGLQVFGRPDYHSKYYDSLINKRKYVR